jgi:hypothetical protein
VGVISAALCIFCVGIRLVQCNEQLHFHDFGRLLLVTCIILLTWLQIIILYSVILLFSVDLALFVCFVRLRAALVDVSSSLCCKNTLNETCSVHSQSGEEQCTKFNAARRREKHLKRPRFYLVRILGCKIFTRTNLNLQHF